MQGLNSPTRNGTHAPCNGRHQGILFWGIVYLFFSGDFEGHIYMSLPSRGKGKGVVGSENSLGKVLKT